MWARVEGCTHLGPEEGADLRLMLVASSPDGAAISAVGIQRLYASEAGGRLRTWIQAPHPLFSQPGIRRPDGRAHGPGGAALARGHRRRAARRPAPRRGAPSVRGAPMTSWLSGDLTGVNPKAELELLQRTVREAVSSGGRPGAVLEGARRPRSGRLRGARRGSAGRRRAPRGALVPVRRSRAGGGALPSGLYGRLASLAPGEAGRIARVAARRHPGARWVWRLAKSDADGVFEELWQQDGAAALIAAIRHGHDDLAFARMPAASAPMLRALYQDGSPQLLERCLAALLDHGGTQPVVAWLAAWHGPDVDRTFARVALRLTTPAGRARLLSLSTDLPITRRHLEAGRWVTTEPGWEPSQGW